MMEELTVGDRVRIDIPDETDPDHDAYHGEHGQIVAVLADDADAITGDVRDTQLYRIELDSGDQTDVRWRDVRPPIDDSSKS